MSLAFWLKVAFNIFELLLYSFFLRWSFGSGLLFHAVKIAYSLPCFSVCISTGTFRAWSRRFPCVLFHVDLTTDQHNTFYRGS
jgi:hypothetical protein